MIQAPNAGLSLRLAQFVTQKSQAQLPPAATRAAARVLLDATGVMRAASGLRDQPSCITAERSR